MKRKIPKFKRQNRDLKKRVGHAWKKPRGIDNKMRVQKGGTGVMPRIGYRQARTQRERHPCGLYEVIAFNVADLAKAAGKAVRIGGSVGNKKKGEIVAKALEMKLKVLNPGKRFELKGGKKAEKEGAKKAEEKKKTEEPKKEEKK